MSDLNLRLGPDNLHDPRVIARRQERFEHWNRIRNMRDHKSLEDEVWSVGEGNLTQLLHGETGNELSVGVEAILHALVTQAWAAYEAAASDLWIAAMNKHAIPLASSFVEHHKDKTLSFSELAKAKFNLSTRMGSYLHAHNKVNLVGLNGIIDAYEKSFGKDCEKILSGSKRELFFVESLRNLIAHKSGKIDQKFLQRIKNIPQLSEHKLGEFTILSGHIVKKVIDVCVTNGVKIIDFVDR